MPQGQPGQGFPGAPGGTFPGGANGYARFRGGPGFGRNPIMMLVFRNILIMELLYVVAMVLLVVAFWMIFKKAGYNGALSLLMLVPLVNLGMVLWLAFAEWPIFKSLREKEALAASAMAQFAGGVPPAGTPAATPPVPPAPQA